MEIKENKNIIFGNLSKKETTYARKGNLFFATRLRLKTQEILLQEIYGGTHKKTLIVNGYKVFMWYSQVIAFTFLCLHI